MGWPKPVVPTSCKGLRESLSQAILLDDAYDKRSNLLSVSIPAVTFDREDEEVSSL